MYLYNLTLKEPTNINHAIVGQFSGTREDYRKGLFEIVVARGTMIELLKPDENSGRLNLLLSVNMFGIIRSIASFRLTGGIKDYLALGSDAGRINILEYMPEENRFKLVHQETFGRSGIRRIVPGQHIACDSKGRAIMIAAVEKQKLVYQLNRDTRANVTISSPLEAHKANTVVFHMTNVDVGFENPLFACLEVDYEEAAEDPQSEAKQSITYYELDLGLNHVVRKYSETLQHHANLLIPVPGGNDGPSGLIVCVENFITYKNFGEQPDITCPIPRRKGETDVCERGILISTWALYKYKEGEQRKFFFYLQTELGDLFKTELDVHDDIVTEIRMTYFETLPTATALCLLPHSRRRVEGALLFVCAEGGNHHLYQIDPVEEEQEQSFSSKAFEQHIRDSGDADDDNKLFRFTPKDIRHLNLIDEVQSLAPLVSATVFNELDDHKLIVACGKQKHSSIRTLQQGLEVKERALSMLPSMATNVWSVRKRCDSIHDEYIVVSFTNATLVLGVGETIDEVVDSGFLGTKSTIGCSQLGDDSLVQIHPDGIRHIHADKRVSEWRTPFKRQIVRCALNQRQVAIALSNHEILYFEMDTTGQLNEYNERKEFTAPISCMAIGEIPPGEIRSQFLAVGIDQKISVISLDLNDCMTELTRQTFTSTPESISIAELGGGRGLNHSTQLYLNVGLQNGELVRTRLDRVSGDLNEPIRRFLGTKPVGLFNVRVKEKQALLACTNKSWLVYSHKNRCQLAPLCYEPFEYAAPFSSAEVKEGIVAISGRTLRVLSLERLGDVYSQKSTPLDATPRRFAVHPPSGNIVAICADRQPLRIHPGDPADKWHSKIILFDPNTSTIFEEVSLDSQSCAISIAMATFGSTTYTVHVGVTQDFKIRTKNSGNHEILTYALSNRGESLELLHRTACSWLPKGMCEWQNRLVVAGEWVEMYSLGKKKLLKKCQSKPLPIHTSTLSPIGNRLIVGDIQEGFVFMKYRSDENVLSCFADDTCARYMVSAGVFDENTVCGGDKFGNIFVLSLPEDVDDDANEDPSGKKTLWDRGYLGGCSQKAEVAAMFHVGDIVTSIQRTKLALGRSECIVYTTIGGAIGALIPFETKDDFEFYQALELHVRQKNPPLCGRDPLAHRSSFFPVKNIVDGDLCNIYMLNDSTRQQQIADEMEEQPGEIISRLDEILDKIL